MTDAARAVRRTYLVLTLLTTLAASFIWGINTLFLLDAGLNNTEAFAANAFFTAGMVLFEVPTGVVADTRGRRLSFLLGAATLLVATLLYFLMWQLKAGLWAWAIVSAALGLGFTFFSGATEAWLVDALGATGFTGQLESVYGLAQSVDGVAMLVGSVAGGYIAQFTNLGVPYLLRAAFLGVTLVVAFLFMRDIGFTPRTGETPLQAVRVVLRGSIEGGLRNPPVRWLMLAAPFTAGVGIYAFYAFQPYLLQLYGDKSAYGIAGLAAAMIAGAQIAGGLAVPWVRRLFARRTHALIVGSVLNAAGLVVIGLVGSFLLALVLLAAWCLVLAMVAPLRGAFINGLIRSEQRATVLSFDSLMGSAGGVIAQPALGRAADAWGYGASYVVAGIVEAVAIPFAILARREDAPSDPMGASVYDTLPPDEDWDVDEDDLAEEPTSPDRAAASQRPVRPEAQALDHTPRDLRGGDSP